ncbi:MAG: hypothetical protein ACFE9L_08710 [Candidatus Hodarchaeota archaeon]
MSEDNCHICGKSSPRSKYYNYKVCSNCFDDLTRIERKAEELKISVSDYLNVLTNRDKQHLDKQKEILLSLDME